MKRIFQVASSPASPRQTRADSLNIPAAQPLKAQPKRAACGARSIHILVAGEHQLAREGLRALLAAQPGFLVVGGAQDVSDALRLAGELRPDILLLDLSVPGQSTFDVMLELRNGRNRPRSVAAGEIPSGRIFCRIIIVTAAIENGDVAKLLRLGVRGVLQTRSPMELVFKCIRKVHDGELWLGRTVLADVVSVLAASSEDEEHSVIPDFGLTAREREVLRLIVEGNTNKGIAQRLSVGEDTVKHHLTNIFDKTGASNRLELAIFALHHRLLERA